MDSFDSMTTPNSLVSYLNISVGLAEVFFMLGLERASYELINILLLSFETVLLSSVIDGLS